MRRFDASPRRATPKGQQSFISCTAPHSIASLPHATSRVRGTPHLRTVSADAPIFSATDSIAGQCDGHSGVASTTMRTAFARCSGEYLLGRDMSSILTERSLYETQGASCAVDAVVLFVHLGDDRLQLLVAHRSSRRRA